MYFEEDYYSLLVYTDENNKIHRLDGAARELSGIRQYFIHGKLCYNFEKYLEKINKNYPEYFPVVFDKYVNKKYETQILVELDINKYQNKKVLSKIDKKIKKRLYKELIKKKEEC